MVSSLLFAEWPTEKSLDFKALIPIAHYIIPVSVSFPCSFPVHSPYLEAPGHPAAGMSAPEPDT